MIYFVFGMVYVAAIAVVAVPLKIAYDHGMPPWQGLKVS
jgi:hypothetical protein